MEKYKLLPYGIANYEQVKREGKYMVDKTQYFERMERAGNFLSYFTVFCNKKYGQICQTFLPVRCLRSNHGESTFALSSRPCPVPICRFAAGRWNLSVCHEAHIYI